jgi:hypothetical protein
MIHQVTISYDDENGQLGVGGMPTNSVLAFGILQLAIALLTKQLGAPQQSPILAPPNGLSLVRPQ